MPYIPKEHEQYELLPACRENGGEVFAYSSKLINTVEKLLKHQVRLEPYGFDSYSAYFAFVDALIAEHPAEPKITQKLYEIQAMIKCLNQKEEWSVLKYVGPTTASAIGLTHGKNYYWPASKKNPVYTGVIDDEEFTSYFYPTDSDLWVILLDPTGMAYRTIHQNGEGHVSQHEYDFVMEQIEQLLTQNHE